MDTTDQKEPFWMHTPLDKMTPSQWESLCDGCGKCCLLKLQEAESRQVRTTKIWCAFSTLAENAFFLVFY